MEFYKKFDRFCARNERFGLKNLMLYIIIGNVAVYLLTIMDPRAIVAGILQYDRYRILSGQVWRLVTYVFVPNVLGSSNMFGAFFFAIMLYFYYTVGRILESRWGAFKMMLFYLSGTLLTSLFALLIGGVANSDYINRTLILAFATLYPDMRVMFFFIIPIRMKILGFIALGFELLNVLTGIYFFPANLLPLAAIANYCLFFGPMLGSFFRRERYKRSKNVINFKNAKRRAEQRRDQIPYHHKCAVCGRTDIDHPELEFRYCSRCNGYYCYCRDHINTHVHIV